MSTASKRKRQASRALALLRMSVEAADDAPAYDGSFGANLKAAREHAVLTQAELGELSGMQPSAISHFESGRREPSIGNLAKLAYALELSTDRLLGLAE